MLQLNKIYIIGTYVTLTSKSHVLLKKKNDAPLRQHMSLLPKFLIIASSEMNADKSAAIWFHAKIGIINDVSSLQFN